VNFNKSLLAPINTLKDKLNFLANSFNCVIGNFPFTYLGISLTTSKPFVADFLPLIKKIVKEGY